MNEMKEFAVFVFEKLAWFLMQPPAIYFVAVAISGLVINFITRLRKL